ncbi:AMP-binding protein [Sediminitomix flava]|uniref:Long-subunit acyl-CoA synthetase (AMP-forming) n=1 Tax=Sediminitomix flava TaxID=379075 RepID=A0A315ZFJ2_SEDFL|nr:AMP-binding protein [Sediminitomix flava]PWJ43933.1 long-subunit acyl-CoA synthetase (AMP-forming) [Sediminitomix flava]
MSTQFSPEWNILDYFYYWEKERGEQTFLRQPFGKNWKIYTWEDVGDQARRVANYLRSLDLPPQSHIGLLSKNCSHWVIADLAIMMAGHVSVPFYPNISAADFRKVFEHSDCKALFVGKLEDWGEKKEIVKDVGTIIRFPHYEGNVKIDIGKKWKDILYEFTPITDSPVPPLDQLWTILYTSGTTGSPKGVMHNYRGVISLMYVERMHGMLKVFKVKNPRYFSYLPLNHVAERVIIESTAIFSGGSISFGESIDTFQKNLEDTQPTLFMSVPRIWSKFYDGIMAKLPFLDTLLAIPLLSGFIKKTIRKKLGLNEAAIILTGAAPTSQRLFNWYNKLGIELQEVYAMTENIGGCAVMRKNERKNGTVGQALPEVEIKIEEGEVVTRASWLMQGYYKDPEKTAEVLKNGWLHTQDIGELDGEGFLKITGRKNDNFKSEKGKFIIPAPIEERILSSPFVEYACLVGWGLKQPIALLQLNDFGKGQEQDILQYHFEDLLLEINEPLARYTQIHAFVITSVMWDVDNYMLTPTMKVRRKEVYDKYKTKCEKWLETSKPVIWEKEHLSQSEKLITQEEQQ